jgi:hypothetical protein
MAFIRQQASLAHEYKKSTLLSSGQLQIDNPSFEVDNTYHT